MPKLATAKKKKKKASGTYFKLVSGFPLRKLEDEEDHDQAMKMVRRLAGQTKLDSGTKDYLKVLVDLVSEYERYAHHRLDTSEVKVGDIIRRLATESGLSLSALGAAIGVGQSNLSEMLNDKRDWSKTAIRELSMRFGLNPLLFLT